MRTLSEIYQANRAQSLALEKALAEAQQQAAEAQQQAAQAQQEAAKAQQQAAQRKAEGRIEAVKNFLTRKFGGEMVTGEAIAKLEQLSSEQLDDLLFAAAGWNSLGQMEDYFNTDRV